MTTKTAQGRIIPMIRIHRKQNVSEANRRPADVNVLRSSPIPMQSLHCPYCPAEASSFCLRKVLAFKALGTSAGHTSLPIRVFTPIHRLNRSTPHVDLQLLGVIGVVGGILNPSNTRWPAVFSDSTTLEHLLTHYIPTYSHEGSLVEHLPGEVEDVDCGIP